MNITRRQFLSVERGDPGRYGRGAVAAGTDDPVAPWKRGVNAHPVSDIPESAQHSPLASNVSPENTMRNTWFIA